MKKIIYFFLAFLILFSSYAKVLADDFEEAGLPAHVLQLGAQLAVLLRHVLAGKRTLDQH